MSTLKRILSMASKALDSKSSSSSTARPASSSGGTDWRDLVRTAADKVTGDSRPAPQYGAPEHRPSTRPQDARPGRPAVTAEDRAAIARYDYLLRTADPEQLEQVHRDAFAKLTPEQRSQVEARLRDELPANEQPRSSAPDDLARAATRGEAQNPGFLKKMFSKPGTRGALAGAGVGAAAGLGLGAAGGLLAAVAGGAVLSSVGGSLLQGVDLDGLAGFGDLGEFGDITGSAGDVVSGVGEQVSGLGEQVSDFSMPDLGDLGSFFDR
ncbi:cation-transporting ATPase [Rathayibacter caricis DSM 15933]|uniref:Cation-transporting ATPase n=1 Tax=Rathayibacter caricis DSM 15933 TaxID=1328867 RepID=A0A2T4UUN3_9MICO|nr:cation-transporting ATPase [Rathayibacter caricis]PTL73240.1 cation-transporting ATPase [Rathayibacter caricis DSM 15933]